MLNKLAVIALGCGALSSGILVLAEAPLFADATASQPVQISKTEYVDFAPGGTIHVKDSFGSLVVEGWDQPQVEITVVKSLGYDSEPAPRATQRLEGVHIVAGRQSNTELTISTARSIPPSRILHPLERTHDVTVEYRIRAPRNSRLVINHAGGFISVTGMTGDVDATNHRGDIVLMLPDLAACSIDAHTRAGVITSDLTSATHRKLSMGENLNHPESAAGRHLLLRMGFGGITIKEMPPEALTPAPAVAK